MNPDDLIKQLTTYADAITAFSCAQAIGLTFAVAKGDGFSKRVTATDGAVVTTIGLILGTGVYCLLVQRCMEMAGALGQPTGVMASAIRSIETGRILMIIGAGALSLVALWLVKLHPKLRGK